MRFLVEKDNVKERKRTINESVKYANDLFTNWLDSFLDTGKEFYDFLANHLSSRFSIYNSKDSTDEIQEEMDEIDEYIVNVLKQVKLAYTNCLKYINDKIEKNVIWV